MTSVIANTATPAEIEARLGLSDCCDGVVSSAQAIRDLLYAADKRPLTLMERFRLQYELQGFCDFSDVTTKAYGSLFLDPDDYELCNGVWHEELMKPLK